MSEFLQSILTTAYSYEPVLVQYGLVIIVAAIAIEGVIIPAPGQTLLIAGALLSTRGDFSIILLLVSATLAAIIGSTLGYVIGRVSGRKLLLRLPIRPTRLESMEAFCQSNGVLLVLLSRFVDGPRQLTGIFVGSLRMPAMTFLLATSAGAILWVGFWGMGSYYLAQHVKVVAQVFESIAPNIWIIVGLTLLLVCLYLLRRHQRSTNSTR
ncbi:MAG: DedA family protein [Thiohalomonadales bacterium]